MQKHKALAFTGHRPESLPFGENELSASAIRIKTLLADEIMRCAAQGYDTFLAGGARGGDILFAEQVLFVKGLEYPDIQLITAVPHEGQANNWTEAWRERYFRILEYSFDVVTLESHYSSGCYHARNRYLVDHADSVLALYNGSPTGGTAYTVKYAYQRNKEIIVIDPTTMEQNVIPPRLRCE